MENKLAVVDNFGLPVMTGEMGQAFKEEMDGLPTGGFDRVKVPSGGSLAWEVPDENGNPEPVKEIVGVIIDHYPVNAYWEDKYSGQNNPPDCSSLDAKTGHDKDGNPQICAACHFNQFGSSPDGGKACKNMHRLYILRRGQTYPIQLTLPPTSLRPMGDYIAKRVLGRSKRSFDVVTKIGLKKAKNKGGIEYSEATFAVDGFLSSDEAQQAAQYSSYIKGITRKIGIEADMDTYDTTATTTETTSGDVPF